MCVNIINASCNLEGLIKRDNLFYLRVLHIAMDVVLSMPFLLYKIITLSIHTHTCMHRILPAFCSQAYRTYAFNYMTEHKAGLELGCSIT